MKINIKTDPETLFLVHKVVLQNTQNLTKNKSGKSMVIELFERISKTCISYSANANGKKRSVELRYHLAEKLLELVRTSIGNFGVYENNKLEIFKNELHQKLL